MIDFKKSLFSSMLVLFFYSPLFAAQKTGEEPASEPEQAQKTDGATARENPVSNVPYESGRVGANWDINRSISILAEIGMGKRSSQMLNFTYRF